MAVLMLGHCLCALALLPPLVPAEQPLPRVLRAGAAARAAADRAKIAGGGNPPTGARVVVKLQRVAARSTGLGGLLPDAGFYVGRVAVGKPEPQVFTVLFDTASGHVVLPSAKCQNASCVERRRYAPEMSPSAQAIRTDGQPVRPGDKVRQLLSIDFMQIDLGDGGVEGGAVRDVVCFGGAAAAEGCAELGLVAADRMADVPFRAVPYDGMVGLGLDGLMFASPLFSVLRSLAAGSAGMLPQFTLALRGPVGELSFGAPGPEASRAFPPHWFPVTHPEDGYWQVPIFAVHVDNRTVEACAGGCRGIVDTGASRLGVPAGLVPKLAAALGASPVPGGGCQGPDLHLDLGGMMLTLRAQDYAGPGCGEARLAPLSLDGPGENFYAGAFVLGESVLRRYDATFDWGGLRIGFSPAVPRAVRLGPPVPGAVAEQHQAGAGDVLRVIQV